MGKRKIILTKEQLDEICGSDSSYLDDLALCPDRGDVNAIEVTADGAIDNGYADNTTTDDFSHMQTNDWMGASKPMGRGSIVVHEMTKKDWINKFVMSEQEQHGNSQLNGRTFGDNGDRKSYSAAKQTVYRKKKAENKLINGTPEEQRKAKNTLNTMAQNSDINAIQSQYESGEKSSEVIRNSKPEGSKIKSAPKQSGNGKAHSPQNGIITYF